MFNYEQETEDRQYYSNRSKYDNNRAQNLQTDFNRAGGRDNSQDYGSGRGAMLARKSPRYESKDQSMDSNVRRNGNIDRKVENVKIIGAARNASFGKS